jgi:hypothetical protein
MELALHRVARLRGFHLTAILDDRYVPIVGDLSVDVE